MRFPLIVYLMSLTLSEPFSNGECTGSSVAEGYCALDSKKTGSPRLTWCGAEKHVIASA